MRALPTVLLLPLLGGWAAAARAGPPTRFIDDVQVTEGTGGTVDAVFMVTLVVPGSAAVEGQVTVQFQTRDGSALAQDGDYQPASGQLTFPPGGGVLPVPVTVVGDAEVEPDENFFVDLFDPVGAVISDGEGEATILDDDQTALSIGDATVVEGDAGTTPATFTVTLSAPSATPVSVEFQTRDGSATAADGDYQPAMGQVVFAPGQLVATLEVQVNGDTTVEPDEDYFVDLFNPVGATIDDGQGEGTIQNDDKAVLAIEDVTVTEGDGGTTAALFTVTLSAPSSGPVTVQFATRDGSATAADGDYQPAAGQLTFDPGDVAETVAVQVHGDPTVEPDESFFVALGDPDGANLGDPEGEGTILNDDQTGLAVDDVEVVEGDAGTTGAVFTVTLSTPSATPVGVDFATRDGTATLADGDYRAAAGRLTLAPGQTSQSLRLEVNGDTRFEPDETFFLQLSNPDGADLADDEGQATIRNDDAQPGAIRLVAAPATPEAAGTAVVTAERVGGSEGPASATLTAGNGTAVAGEDFTAASRVLSWAAGESGARTFELEILDDGLQEGDETVVLTLSGASGAALGEPSRLELVILDDDQPMALEAVGELEVTATVGEELELRVRATRQDGRPVQGATVAWRAEGAARLVGADSTLTDDGGETGQTVELAGAPGRATVGASLAGTDSVVLFELAIQGDLDRLFEAGPNPGEASVAGALNDACREPEGELVAGCDYLFGLDPEDQRRAVRELTPREVAAQGTVSAGAQQTQLRNIGARLAARRGGGGSALDQLALRVRGAALPVGILYAALRGHTTADVEPAPRLDLWAAAADGEAAEEAATVRPDPAEQPSRQGFFINGRVSIGDRPGTAREEGFEVEIQGLTAGWDYLLSPRLLVGVAVGAMDTDTELAGDGGGLDSEGYTLSVYATYFLERLYLEGIVGRAWNDFEAVRHIDLPQPFQGRSRLAARGRPAGRELLVGVGLGYDASLGGATSVGGYARLSRVETDVDGYAESGAGPFNLAIGDQNQESLLAEAAFELSRAASRRWGVLQPVLRVSYFQELADDSRLIRGRFVDDAGRNEFAVPTDPPDRSFFNLSVGLTATLARGRSAYLFYDTDLERDDLDLYTLSAGLRFEL